MPVDEAFRVARGGFTRLAGEIDHHARALIAALKRQFNDHLDTTAAHTAANISFAPTGALVSTDVQSLASEIVLDLVTYSDGQLATHAADTTSVHGITDTSALLDDTVFDAKGDLLSASAADTPARLAVGTNDEVLVAASGETTGLKWGPDVQTWTPTISGVTAGAAVVVANYVRIGTQITFAFTWTFGAGSAVTGPVTVTLPVAAATPTSFQATFLDFGTTRFQGDASVGTAGSSTMNVFRDTGSGLENLSSTLPMTWASGDKIQIAGAYLV